MPFQTFNCELLARSVDLVQHQSAATASSHADLS
jgi:hypothetical protein